MLERVPDAENYRFHQLLTIEELQVGDIPIEDLLRKADDRLNEHVESGGRVDAVVGYWDFPVSTMVPILRRRFGSRGPSLESVRQVRAQVLEPAGAARRSSTSIRGSALVDLDRTTRGRPRAWAYPMWLKPVKSFSSELAFGVDDDDGVPRGRRQHPRGHRPGRRPVRVPARPARAPAARSPRRGGRACLAEEALSGRQVAVEGYVHDGRVTIYGSSTRSTTRQLELPAPPVPVHAARARAATRLPTSPSGSCGRSASTTATFSIEYFYDPGTDAINLLEINPRHSQSHAELFEHGRRRAQPPLHGQPGAGPGPAPAAPGRRRTPSRPSGTCGGSPTAWSPGADPGEEIGAGRARRPRRARSRSLPEDGDRGSPELPTRTATATSSPTSIIGARDEDDCARKYDRCRGARAALRDRGRPSTVTGAHGLACEDGQLELPASRSTPKTKHVWIPCPTAPGSPARIWRPAASDDRPVPAVLEYIPYRKRDLTVGARLDPPPLHRGARLRLRAGRPARHRRVRGRAHRRVPRAGTVRRRGGARLARRAALVRRPHRDDGHLLGRVRRAAGRRPPAAEPARDRHRLVHRRPVRRRHALHGRLPCSPTTCAEAGTMFAYGTCPPDPAVVGERWREMWHERLDAARPWVAGVAAPPAPRRLLAARVGLRGLQRDPALPGARVQRLGRRLLQRGDPAAGATSTCRARG